VANCDPSPFAFLHSFFASFASFAFVKPLDENKPAEFIRELFEARGHSILRTTCVRIRTATFDYQLLATARQARADAST
jgi:hypothetical protein